MQIIGDDVHPIASVKPNIVCVHMEFFWYRGVKVLGDEVQATIPARSLKNGKLEIRIHVIVDSAPKRTAADEGVRGGDKSFVGRPNTGPSADDEGAQCFIESGS